MSIKMPKCLFTIIKETLSDLNMEVSSISPRQDEIYFSFTGALNGKHYEGTVTEGCNGKDLITIKNSQGSVLAKEFFDAPHGFRNLSVFETALHEAVCKAFNTPYDCVDTEINQLKSAIVSTVIAESIAFCDIIGEINKMDDLVLRGVVSKKFMYDFLDYILVTISTIPLTSNPKFQMVDAHGHLIQEFDCLCKCYIESTVMSYEISVSYK